MKYRRLGRTDLKISVVGVGTWQYGGDWGKAFAQDEVNAILARAKELDVNLIDTAACYGPDHLSEKLVGGFLKDENREDWIVATKFGHRPGWQPDEVRQTLAESLRCLNTDYIDLYQFHSGNDEQFNTPGLWDMLAEQVEAGTIRHLGISLSMNGPSLFQAESAPGVGVSAMQINYSRLNQGPEEEIFPACQERDLGVLARTPLASGLLSGKYAPGTKFPENDLRADRDADMMRSMMEEAQRIQAEEVPEGVNMAQWALAWCLKHPAVTCVIPGCKSVAQVESNAAAADLDMVAEDHPQACR
jgi:aryl-alcohol dehydrogenase-like predicted oxidoreductase